MRLLRARHQHSWGVKKRALFVPVAVAAGLVIGAGHAFAFQKDPDTIDVGHAPALVTQLLAPNPAIGSTDTTPVGVGTAVVGSGNLTTASSNNSGSSHGRTYFVDNTPNDGDCPPTPYTTIQAAINASGPGDTVKVCPGTYTEQPVISGHTHDGLELESVRPLRAVIQWPATPSTNHQLVDVTGANRVEISGFTISGPFPSTGCSVDRYEGVLFDNSFNGALDHNVITLIRDSNSGLYGCQQGDAVAIGHRNFNTAGSASVDHNLIDRYQKNGVQAVNSGTSAFVDHNTIMGSTDATLRAIIASNGVVVFGGATATVEHNSVSGNEFTNGHFSTGIILDEAPAGSSEIDHNTVFGNDYGIEADSETNLDISHNDVLNNTNDAISLCGDATAGCGSVSDIVVRANEVENNGGSGIFLQQANANLLKANHVEGNGGGSFGDHDGIHVDANSSNNEIVSNQLESNVTFDCQDASHGTGTAGTANDWEHDHGQTSSPPGLCTQRE